MKKFFFKILLLLCLPVVKFYWFLLRPETTGVKCIIRYNDQILLIRNSYGRRLWTLPGGGVKRGESAEDAVVREVKEEVGIFIRNPKKLGTVFYDGEYKKNTIWVFAVTVTSPVFARSSLEIADINWYGVKELPREKSHLLAKFLALVENFDSKETPAA